MKNYYKKFNSKKEAANYKRELLKFCTSLCYRDFLITELDTFTKGCFPSDYKEKAVDGVFDMFFKSVYPDREFLFIFPKEEPEPEPEEKKENMKTYYRIFDSKKEAEQFKNAMWQLRDHEVFLMLLDDFSMNFPADSRVLNSDWHHIIVNRKAIFFIHPKEEQEQEPEPKHKTKFHLVPFDFIAKMADNMDQGNSKNGRKEGDWARLEASPEVIDLYVDKLMRHLVRGDYVAVACNAMILDHLANKPIFSEE